MKNIKDKLALGFIKLAFVWTLFALSFQVTMLTLSVVNPELETKIGNEIMWKIDGAFKNDPDNIWYEGPKNK
jgi:hypothetical protein